MNSYEIFWSVVCLIGNKPINYGTVLDADPDPEIV